MAQSHGYGPPAMSLAPLEALQQRAPRAADGLLRVFKDGRRMRLGLASSILHVKA